MLTVVSCRKTPSIEKFAWNAVRNSNAFTDLEDDLMSYKSLPPSFTLAMALLFTPTLTSAQQYADTLFAPGITSPAFASGSGLSVLIDEAHCNFHTMQGRYLPFARLLQRDGYIVLPQRTRFTRDALDRARILVIANALAKENEDDWNLPTPSAFDSAEIGTVREWVRDGGSLWLIADHMPFPGAAESLAAQFGILMGNGFALDAATESGQIRFSRTDNTLADHPITRGRNLSERIDSVVAFTGQAFRLDGQGEALMRLQRNIVLLMPEVAWQFSKLTPSLSASGMLQGAAIHFGKGRVAVFGEAAMFSAQISEPGHRPAGMNHPAAPQNAQFLLNVVHWLSGLI